MKTSSPCAFQIDVCWTASEHLTGTSRGLTGGEEAEDAQCTVTGYHIAVFSVRFLFLFLSNREAMLLLKKRNKHECKKRTKKIRYNVFIVSRPIFLWGTKQTNKRTNKQKHSSLAAQFSKCHHLCGEGRGSGGEAPIGGGGATKLPLCLESLSLFQSVCGSWWKKKTTKKTVQEEEERGSASLCLSSTEPQLRRLARAARGQEEFSVLFICGFILCVCVFVSLF